MSKITVNFDQFDPDQHLASLDIEASARRDAGLNLPGTESNSLSTSEIKIIQRVKSFHDEIINTCDRHLLEQEIQDANALRQSDGHDGQVSSLRIDLTSEYASHKDRVNYVNKNYKNALHALDFFKKENGLVNEANLKNSTTKSLLLLIVIFMFIFEVSVNTSLMQGAVSGGILGALSLSSVIGFVNIVSSFLVGRLVLPRVIHKKSDNKSLSWVALAAYVPIVIYLNFALGVFRSQSQKAMETFSNEALQLATEKAAMPFSYIHENTLESNGLIIIGLLFAVISIIDGYNFDEPFPRYANLAKKAQFARDKFEANKREGFEILHQQQLKGNKQIKDFKEKREEANRIWANNIDSVQALFTDFSYWTKSLDEMIESLVNEYRALNKHFRSTEPPIYFMEPVGETLESDPNKKFYSLSASNITDKEKDKGFLKANGIIISEYTKATAELNEMYESIIRQYELYLEGIK